MSKQNNLTDFLTDVANAIRAKKGSTDLINPQNFSSEIASLPSGLEIVDMTETTATIEPNKVYVWGMVESLDITLGASTDESDFFAFRFRCSKPTMTSLTVNGATWADDTELDAQGKPVLDLGSWYQCEIKGGTSALYARLAHYIHFADSNVEAVLLANGVGDGIGITYKDAAKVTTIPESWFKGNTDITSFNELKLFLNIKTIETGAFYKCTNLVIEELNCPNLTQIGAGAFNGTRLKKITGWGNGIILLNNNSAYGGVFENCSELTEISKEAQLKIAQTGVSIFKGTSLSGDLDLSNCSYLGTHSFENLTGLTSLIISTSVTDIGIGAFYKCTNLVIEELNCPNLTRIGAGAFNGTRLKKIVSLGSITSLPPAAGNRGAVFESCTELTDISQNVLDKLTKIADAFYNCTALAIDKLKLPALTGTLTDGFNNCPIRMIVDLGNITNYYADSALKWDNKNFGSVKEVIILPASLTRIGRYTFTGCTNLKALIIKAETPPSLAAYHNISDIPCAIYVPNDSLTSYQEATGWTSIADKFKAISQLAYDNPDLYSEIEEYI